uniref:Capsid fiber protein n=1 Tax=Siphoviridae sp. ctu061 TaxID=2825710 RepID=A0A8S5U6K8_9CAUD|nr:MAG TPA: capsid fiber protein [Siphoviridae sp. ctu061]
MGKNFNGTQINNSATISEKAGAEIADCRNRILKYDGNGDVVLATAGTDIPVGVAIIEAGYNDISGTESGKVAIGDDVDILVKDIGFVLSGATITKGQEITAGANGLAAVAKDGEYVLGVALSSVEANEYCRIQITKYHKAAATAGGEG